jgi:hypothetical protein
MQVIYSPFDFSIVLSSFLRLVMALLAFISLYYQEKFFIASDLATRSKGMFDAFAINFVDS